MCESLKGTTRSALLPIRSPYGPLFLHDEHDDRAVGLVFAEDQQGRAARVPDLIIEAETRNPKRSQ